MTDPSSPSRGPQAPQDDMLDGFRLVYPQYNSQQAFDRLPCDKSLRLSVFWRFQSTTPLIPSRSFLRRQEPGGEIGWCLRTIIFGCQGTRCVAPPRHAPPGGSAAANTSTTAAPSGITRQSHVTSLKGTVSRAPRYEPPETKPSSFCTSGLSSASEVGFFSTFSVHLPALSR